jgi:hypothetical protein
VITHKFLLTARQEHFATNFANSHELLKTNLREFVEFVAKILLSALELAGTKDVGNHQKLEADGR